MKKYLSLFKRKRVSRTKFFDPFSLILTLVLIVIIPNILLGNTTLQYPPIAEGQIEAQQTNIYKEKLLALTKEIAAQPNTFSEHQKQINLILQPELFDITLTIDSPSINKSSDLVAHIEFVSFGTQPTLVNFIYSIKNSVGKEVFSESDQAIVETEKVVTKEFDNLDLKGGKYTLIVATTYGQNVQDEFKQTFTIKGISNLIKNIIIIIIILIIVGCIVRKYYRK